ncbi:MAG: nitrite reductase small subunit NirD [Acidobacteria bacterium]|nr:nitrite reductase small subunit NirD [Acidobacteriota bacterium]MBI3473232.1 nitrite reductase small subunit NirD [Candidatus Solibacter usitatus]
MNWIRITRSDNIPLREGRSVRIGSRQIAVFNLGQRFLAVENRCPHGGGPLADGILSGCDVVCPLHAWKVCLETGQVRRPSVEACVATFPVRVEDGVVQVQLPSPAEAAA